MTTLRLAEKKIGPEYPTYFVADISANHDGSLERARLLIHLAAGPCSAPQLAERLAIAKPTVRRILALLTHGGYVERVPDDFGGIGRFTSDLATGLAALGHEVHVVTRSPDVNRVDFEDGVWLHRLLPQIVGVEEAERIIDREVRVQPRP